MKANEDILTFKIQISELKKENSQLKRKNLILQSENQRLKESENSYELNMQKIQENYEKLKKENRYLLKQINSQKFKDEKTDDDNLFTSSPEKEEAITKITNNYQKSKKLLFQCKNQVVILHEKNKLLKSENSKLRKIVDGQRNNINKVIIENDSLKKKYDNEKQNTIKMVNYLRSYDRRKAKQIYVLKLALRKVKSLIIPLQEEFNSIVIELNKKDDENELKNIIIKRLKDKIIDLSQNKEEEDQDQCEMIVKLKNDICFLKKTLEKVQNGKDNDLNDESDNLEIVFKIKNDVDLFVKEFSGFCDRFEQMEEEGTVKDILIEKLKKKIKELDSHLPNI